ncbi:MAG: hypothetical protein Q8O64_20565 [Sideroxyarcus sp.]|nr:hypothetical protein [Sideroxyarcus sp.]
MAANLKICAFILGAMLYGITAAADALRDPTRPAFDLIPGPESSEAAVATAAPQGLQSVILSTQREAAIINGEEVEVGQKYGDAMLTVVNETCVVLMGPRGRQVMHMFPTVNLSKTELACAGRNGLQTIGKVASKPAIKKTHKRKAAKVKKKVVTCVGEEIKNGSKK